MNTVVEKLAAIEKEVAAIQPKMLPLTERIADLHQKVTGFTQQLADLAAESIAVKQDVELTQQCLGKIQTLISESKVESEQLVAGQEENLQRCETMTAVFGAAFQAVSQFFETAQRMGLADQAKAVFTLPQVSVPAALPQPDVVPVSSISETVAEESPEPMTKPSEVKASVMETSSVDEPIPANPPAVEPDVEPESVLSESDLESAIPSITTEEPDSLNLPSLPDVAAPLEVMQAEPDDFTDVPPSEVSPSDTLTTDILPSAEMASHLDVPPLNLSVPDLPASSEPVADDADDQEIEAMLASMMSPVTAAAGS